MLRCSVGLAFIFNRQLFVQKTFTFMARYYEVPMKHCPTSAYTCLVCCFLFICLWDFLFVCLFVFCVCFGCFCFLVFGFCFCFFVFWVFFAVCLFVCILLVPQLPCIDIFTAFLPLSMQAYGSSLSEMPYKEGPDNGIFISSRNVFMLTFTHVFIYCKTFVILQLLYAMCVGKQKT